MNIDISPATKQLQALYDGFVAALPNLVLAIIVFAIFWFLARFLRGLVTRIWASRDQGQNVARVLGRLASGLIIFVGLLISLSVVFPTINAASLLSALGVGGVAVGFAFREILQNLLAGILILLTQPFHIGDQIVVGDAEGTVEDILVRATVLRTYDNRQVVIPNSDLFTNRVTVNTGYDKRRLQYDVGIGYGDDVARAKQLMLEAVGELEGVLSDPAPEALVVDLAGSSVNIRLRWWINPPRRKDAVSSVDTVLHAVRDKLIGGGVDLPFPTQQILFHDQTEATDGDRRQQREGWPAGKGEVPRPRWKVLEQKQAAQASSAPAEPKRQDQEA